MKVLITGSTGLVGREIVAELSANNIETAQVNRRKQKSVDAEIFDSSDYFQADISNKHSLKPLEKLGTIDVVVHCAGLAHQFKNIDGSEFEKVNVLGTKNILDAAVKLKARHFILISSTAVYGIKEKSAGGGNFRSIDGTYKIREDDVLHPETPYAESKLRAEEAALEVCGKNGISLTILRLSPVVGEGSAGNVARLIEAIDKRKFIWVGTGANFKSMIYKRDAARACVRIITGKKSGIETFNLAGEPIRMREFVDCIHEALGRKSPVWRVPSFVLEPFFRINSRLKGIRTINNLAKTIEKWLSDDVYSAEKIAAEYDFRPEISPADAVKRQVEWYKSEKKKPVKSPVSN